MLNRKKLFTFIFIMFAAQVAFSQLSPYVNWTLLPDNQMDEIVGEASGETAWNTIMETGGYNKDRLSDEYRSTFYESKYIYDRLKQYGLPGAAIERFPGGEVWDGIRGELWEVKPLHQKLASYRDMTAMLVRGSSPADVEAELVWIGTGKEEDIDSTTVTGKIVVTEGSIYTAHRIACIKYGALGVVAISMSRPYLDPIQIPWRGIGGRGGQESKFGFYLPYRSGYFLKKRLLNGEKITVHAVVESKMEKYEIQDVVCHIPGTDPDAGEVIFSAHLFEGIVKQGANDNKSGSAAILEVARVLHGLIEEGRLPRQRRTIRFVWGPEFSGIGRWVKNNKRLMEKTLCNINMDMVGEWLTKNKAYMSLIRTSYGNPHYINDVMENYYRYVGKRSREHIHTRSSGSTVFQRIVAPTGADEPFYYTIEPHYGASDHEVFNDWGVGVPGVMMIAWPDQWYHTSGDRVDKSDPTQLKRVVIIGAAAAYTIASADDDMAIRIAGEIAANGTRRLARKFMLAQERLNRATPESIIECYKMARSIINASIKNEEETLRSVLELATDKKRVSGYVKEMLKVVDTVGNCHLQAIERHMKAVAERLKIEPPEVILTDLEKEASLLIPRPTELVKKAGYRGYSEYIDKVSKEAREKYKYRWRDIASMSDLRCCINGRNSVIEIKWMLDAQYGRSSDLKSILNYLQILKLAGLIEM